MSFACGESLEPSDAGSADASRDAAEPVDVGEPCIPDCVAAECGDDGCGGSCGPCPRAAPFCMNATCVSTCQPECANKECGDDGCGGSCGSCPMAAPSCVSNACMVACTPSCAEKQCGDDGCGGSCGTCQSSACTNFRCSAAPSCIAGETRCTDAYAYEVCGAETSDSDRSFGARIPCWEGNACSNGSCVSQCGTPEVLLVIDRSSSMQGARWSFVRAAILDFVAAYQTRARIALRMFPSGGGCDPGMISGFGTIDTSSLDRALEAPSADSQTPIAAALQGLAQAFGDPNQGQAVVLITDGDETCASDPRAAVATAETLSRSGIQVFTIGISQAVNPVLMSSIAGAGRTTAQAVNDGGVLTAALDNVLTSLGVCPPTSLGAVGQPCQASSDCLGGLCLTNELFTWNDGYCTQSCTASMTCPTGSSCIEAPGTNNSFCLQNCIVSCRPGYACAEAPGSGQRVCLPAGM